jgi:transposase
VELEWRRRQAVVAVEQGESPETVARVLGINRASVYRWLRQANEPDGLAAKPHPGPAPRLSLDNHARLETMLHLGPQAHGWSNRLWTCARVAELIRRNFGVSFHHDHVGRFLRARLNWSPQKPRRRARERDEEAIAHWKRVTFPRIARAACRRGAHLVFLDESGLMLTPTVRRTVVAHSVRRARRPEHRRLALGTNVGVVGIVAVGRRQPSGTGRTLSRMDWVGRGRFIFFSSWVKQLWPTCHQRLISAMTLTSVNVGK